METKHTPGPWRYGEALDGKNRVFAAGLEIVSALSTHGTRKLTNAERDANARLIAAAPELYEACKGIDARLGKMLEAADRLAIRGDKRPLQFLREWLSDDAGVGAAIAKAEGK